MNIEKPLFHEWLIMQLAITGYNQARLAKKLAIHRSIISNWVVGRHIPEPSGLLELAKALELPEKEIIGMLQAIINTIQARKE